VDIFKPLSDPVPLPRTINPAIPPAVEPVILKALNKIPEERYSSAITLVQALAETSGVYTLPLIYDRRQDWGDAPAVQSFFGRHKELLNLEKWLVDDRCQLVALLGLEGTGKTSLAVKLAEQVKEHFEVVIWRSLRNVPLPDELLSDLLQVLAGPAVVGMPAGVEPKIADFLQHLHRRRCLLVLDSLETILDRNNPGGGYQPGYQAYAELFRRVGESRIQSCLLLTGREKPPAFELLEEPAGPVRSLSLAGLIPATAQTLLKARGLRGGSTAWIKLIERYSGNPLALKLVAETVCQVFDGQIEAFLQEETAFFGSLRQIFAQYAAELTPLEQSLLLWLAVERESVPREVLRQNLVGASPGPGFVETLQSLRRRSLVEKNSHGFTLQNMVLEYATERLIERVFTEISQADLAEPETSLPTLDSYALLKAQAKDYIRDSQARLILAPIVERLQKKMGRVGVEARLSKILASLRQTHPSNTGYAAGNILHLLMQLGSPLAHFDFSNLTVRQAHLAQTGLTDVNFAGAALLDPVSFDTFGGILSLVYSPTGDLLAAGTTKGEVRIWQAATGRLLFNLRGHSNWIQAVIFSPDGRSLASSSTDGTIRMWNTASGTCFQTLSGTDGRLLSLTFSPDGQFLISGGSDHTIRIWALDSGECIQTLTGHHDWVLSVSFGPDGRTLASSGRDHTVRMWDIERGQLLHSFTNHTAPVWSVAFSPNGRYLASASDDGTVRIWDAVKRRRRHILADHTGPVKCVAFSPDGHVLASGSNDQTVRLWLVDSGQALQSLPGHTSWVWAVAFHPTDQTLVSGSYNQEIRLWEVGKGRCIQTWHGYAGWVSALALNPLGETLATGEEDGVVRIWDTATGRIQRTLRGHTNWLSALAYSPDGRLLASASADRTVCLWETETGPTGQCLHGHTGWVWSVAFSPDSRLLASSSEDQQVRVWDVASGQCLHTLSGHTAWVRSVAFHPRKALLASGSDDHTIRLWNVESGQLLHVISGHTDWVMAVSFSPDGRLLASASADGTVRLSDVENRQEVAKLAGSTGRIRSIAFDPTGKRLVSGGDDYVVWLWDIDCGQEGQTLAGHTDIVKAVAFDPNGPQVASCSDDGTTRLWDIQSGTCRQILRSDRPYERMNITNTTGLTEAQREALKTLGAIEIEGEET
jgi:WD40 repeat protein